MTIKPFDTYFGGKAGSGTYQTIINQIPPHRVYVEPFVGNGSIWRHKAVALLSVLNDVDTQVVDRWVKAMMPECNQIDRVQAGSQIFNRDAIQFLTEFRQWFDRKDTFLYIDPPYPHSSRKSNTRYAWEMSDEEHRQLLTLLNGYRYAKMAISTYPNDIYADKLKPGWGWRRIEFESTTRGGPATEWLFMNYPEPDQLHDYKYLGDDYREREQFARISRRWRSKLKRLPPLLQQKLLADLSSTTPTK